MYIQKGKFFERHKTQLTVVTLKGKNQKIVSLFILYTLVLFEFLLITRIHYFCYLKEKQRVLI